MKQLSWEGIQIVNMLAAVSCVYCYSTRNGTVAKDLLLMAAVLVQLLVFLLPAGWLLKLL